MRTWMLGASFVVIATLAGGVGWWQASRHISPPAAPIPAPAPATPAAAPSPPPEPAPRKPAPGVHAVVAEGLLVGAVRAGAGINDTEAVPLVAGGERYRLYSMTRFVGTATGTKPSVNENFPDQAASVDLAPMPSGAEPVIAIAGDWDALPRVPVQIAATRAHRDAVAARLRKAGIRKPQVHIIRVLRVDLEGDGQDEEIVNATHAAGPPYSQAGIGLARTDYYSVVLLLRTRDGATTVIPLDEGIYPRRAPDDAARFALAPVLDIDGDGVQEVLTRWEFYAGDGHSAWRVGETKAERLFVGGFMT